jgi:hypothetical protein
MIFSNKLKIGVSTVLRVSTVIAFCLFMFIPIAQAEQPYDITSCHSGKIKALFADKEMTIWSGEGWGIIMSNHENKVFDNCTFHVMTVIQVMGDRTTETGFLKTMDPDGDIVVAQTSRVGTESITKFLHGTGKYKGITGGGKSHRIVFGRIPPDSAAACSRGIGTFELPKK